VYKTVDGDNDEESYTYLKILNIGKQVIINRIQDYLQSRIVYYLMNLHIRPRSVWLSRVSPADAVVLAMRAVRVGADSCCSTASRCTTLMAELEGIRSSPPGVSCTLASSPSSSASRLV
jgi:hypothetical protein